MTFTRELQAAIALLEARLADVTARIAALKRHRREGTK